MKLNNTLTLLALAGFAVSASATNTYNVSLVSTGTTLRGVTFAPGAVDDVYSFAIDSATLLAISRDFVFAPGDTEVDLANGAFQLYSGIYGSGVAYGASAPITEGYTYTTYPTLAAGSYYLEVTGTAAVKGSDYAITLYGANSPLLAVPEPANAALLLGGLGLMGFVSRRRNRQ